MKVTNSGLLMIAILCSFFSMQSCEKDDPCGSIFCLNEGITIEGSNDCECDCSNTFYLGEKCEKFNPSKIQASLDNGVTPKELFDGNIPLDSLYGKFYSGGLIFYLNIADGTGLVAATEDQSTNAQWGCNGLDIVDLNNYYTTDPLTTAGARIGDGEANTNAILKGCADDGIAAKICRDIGPDWFLPSSSELNLMYTNLHKNGHGGFAEVLYWSSSEAFPSLAWYQGFAFGYPGGDYKFSGNHVRAVRAF